MSIRFAESTAVGVLPFLEKELVSQIDRLVWFAVYFPSTIVLLIL